MGRNGTVTRQRLTAGRGRGPWQHRSQPHGHGLRMLRTCHAGAMRMPVVGDLPFIHCSASGAGSMTTPLGLVQPKLPQTMIATSILLKRF